MRFLLCGRGCGFRCTDISAHRCSNGGTHIKPDASTYIRSYSRANVQPDGISDSGTNNVANSITYRLTYGVSHRRANRRQTRWTCLAMDLAPTTN